MKTLLQCGLLALALGATLPAVPLIQTYDFTGTCTDCPDFGYGTLTATTDNNAVTFAFNYNSDWISYSLPSALVAVNNVPFSGSSFTYNPAQSIYIQGTGQVTSNGGSGNPLPVGTSVETMYFLLQPTGDWYTGVNSNSDFGTAGAFVASAPPTGVPEPASFALVGAGAGLLFLLRRRTA